MQAAVKYLAINKCTVDGFFPHLKERCLVFFDRTQKATSITLYIPHNKHDHDDEMKDTIGPFAPSNTTWELSKNGRPFQTVAAVINCHS